MIRKKKRRKQAKDMKEILDNNKNKLQKVAN